MSARLALAALLAATPLWVGRFSGEGIPPPWRIVRLSEKVAPTVYRGATIQGVGAIEARADRAMALLARPIDVDLSATPILCWRWLVDAPVARADMRRRSGDDYAARVYVAFDMPESALGLGTRIRLMLARRLFGSAVPDAALNYVWDNRNPVGTRRRSAFTDRVELIVAETGSARAGGGFPSTPILGRTLPGLSTTGPVSRFRSPSPPTPTIAAAAPAPLSRISASSTAVRVVKADGRG